MGKRDITGKEFFSDRERFAELVNLHLYRGERVLLPEDLVLVKREYPSLAAVYGQKNRDILMKDTKQKIYYGVELETESDYSMPERIMVYDACEYEQQIREIYRRHREAEDFENYTEKKSRIKKNEFLLPVVTLVLYLGEGHWEGRYRLTDLFHMAGHEEECLGNTIQDYEFLLLEADFLRPEDYKTELKAFFQAMQCRQDKGRLKELLHSDDFRQLCPETELAIAAHLHIKRLVQKMKKEDMPMCKAFDDLMKEERRSGKREGKKEARRDIISRMKKEGMDEAQIIRLTRCTKKEYTAAVSGI